MQLTCPHCHSTFEPPDSTAADVLCPSCGSSFRLERGASTIEVRDGFQGQMGKFELLLTLGVGAFGTVYKARDSELERTVAIKVPRAGSIGSGEHLERFLREARSVAQLRHPHIVPVHEVGQLNGVPYLVSDFIEGVTLADHLTGRRPTFGETARLLADVADALHFAHNHGVTHRDVKPSNILLDAGGQPHVLDFGLAKRDAGEITMTLEGQVLGTPAYMSPEQARGESHSVDGRGDVYSMGVILYEMLTGELPFRGNTRMLLHQLLHDDPKPPRSLNDRIPRDLETVCLKALAKEPSRRYPSAGEMAADLRRWQRGEPILARPVGRVEKLWRWCRRHPSTAGLAAAVVALFVLAIVGSVLTVSASHIAAARDEAASARDALKAANADLDAARDREEAARRAAEDILVRLYVVNGVNEMEKNDLLAPLPWFVEALAIDQNNPGRAKLHRLRLAALLRQSPRLLQVFFHDAGVRHAAFSPDGKRLLTVCPKSARVWDVASGQPVTPPLTHDGTVTHAVFSPDGRRVVTTGEDNVGRLWDVESGQALPVTLRHEGAVGYAVFSPDGRRIVTAGKDNTARVWDAGTGKQAALLQHVRPVKFVAFSANGSQIVSTSDDKKERLWNASTGESIEPSFGPVNHADFSPNGANILLATPDGVTIWDIGTRKSPRTVQQEGSVLHAAFSPDGRRVVTVGEDNSVSVWDASTSQRVMTRKYDGPVHCVAFSPDGRRLAIAGNDGTARVWDSTTGEFSPALVHGSAVRWTAFSPDGDRLVTASEDGSARVYDVLPPLPTRMEAAGKARPVIFSPDGRRMVAVDAENRAQVYDVTSGRAVSPPVKHERAPDVIRFSPDGRRVLSADNETLRIWDATTGQDLFPPVQTRVQGWVDFTPDGRGFFSVNADGTVSYRDAASGLPLAPAGKVTGKVVDFVFLPQGCRYIVFEAGKVRVRDAASDQAVFPPLGPAGKKQFAKLSPDGSRAVTIGDDKKAQVWDVASGQTVCPPLTHDGSVNSAHFSPDGARVITTGDEGTARIWDVASGQLLVPPLKPAWMASFSDDGRCVFTFGSDTRRVWDAFTGQPLTPPLKKDSGGSHFLWQGLGPDGSCIVGDADDLGVWTWDFVVDAQPVEDLRKLAQVLSGRRLDANGATVYVPIDAAQWQELRGRYSEEFAVSPQRVLVWRRREAEAAAREEHWSAVVFHTDRLLRAEPGSADLLRQRARAHHQLGADRLALADLNRILDEHPADEEAWLQRGWVHVILGELEQARQDFTKAIELAPEDGTAWLGRYLAQAEDAADFSRALDLSHAIRLRGDTLSVGRKVILSVGGRVLDDDTESIWRTIGLSPLVMAHWQGAVAECTLALLTRSDDWRLYRARGLAYAALWDRKEALADFARATELKPEDGLSWLARARYEVEQEEWDKALASCDKALELNVPGPDVWYLRGRSYFNKGFLDKCRPDYDRAIAMGLDGWRIRLERGNVCRELRQNDQAIADYTEVLRQKPINKDTWNNRGLCYHRKGDTARAIADYTEAIRLNAGDGIVFLNRGRAYFQQRDYDKAVADFDEAIRLRPNETTIHNERGVAYHRMREWDKAIADYTEAIRLDPTRALYYFNRGFSHANKGDPERARADYDAAFMHATFALQENPKDVDSLGARGLALAQKGEHEQAVADFTEALMLQPANAFISRIRGESHFTLGHYDLALADYSAALEITPRDDAVWNLRGVAHARKSEWAQAVADYSEALRLNPGNSLALRNRGEALFQQGGYERALADYSEALRLNPRDDAVYNLRGLLRARRREFEQTIADYGEAIRLNPANLSYRINRVNTHSETAAWDKVEADCDEVIVRATEVLRGNPKNALAYHHRAWARDRKGETEQAVADYTEAIRLNPRDAVARNNRGVIRCRQGAYDEALVDFAEAIRLAPKNAVHRGNRALALARKGNKAAALDESDESLRLDQTNPDAHSKYAQVMLELGDEAKYRAGCADMVERFGRRDDLQAVHAVAWTCSLAPGAVADLKPVVEQVEKAIGQRPNDPALLHVLGAVLYRTDRAEDAVQRLKEAVAKGADQGGTVFDWLFLALAQHRLGRADEARKSLETAGQRLERARIVTWKDQVAYERLQREVEEQLKK